MVLTPYGIQYVNGRETERMNFKRHILPILIIILLIFVDQATKQLVIKYIPLHKEVHVIGDKIVFTHIKNSGSAWSLLEGKTVFLLIITFIVMAGLIYIYHNIVNLNDYFALKCSIISILGGAVGNMIDRLRMGCVTDFIYFKFIHFPVFNFADICVTVSIFVVLFLFIFKYKSEDMDKIFGDKKEDSMEE